MQYFYHFTFSTEYTTTYTLSSFWFDLMCMYSTYWDGWWKRERKSTDIVCGSVHFFHTMWSPVYFISPYPALSYYFYRFWFCLFCLEFFELILFSFFFYFYFHCSLLLVPLLLYIYIFFYNMYICFFSSPLFILLWIFIHRFYRYFFSVLIR